MRRYVYKNQKGNIEGRFKHTVQELVSTRSNLNATATCAHAISQLIAYWGKADKEYYGDLSVYVDKLIEGVIPEPKSPESPEESNRCVSPDEFTIMNVLSVLHDILERQDIDSNKNKIVFDKIVPIIRELCRSLLENQLCTINIEKDIYSPFDAQFNFEAIPHPYIYYKFIKILSDWSEFIDSDIKSNTKLWILPKRYFDILEINERKGGIKKFFFDIIYSKAKYELYRQLSLYYSGGPALFDPKRMLYSLLIIKMNDRYSNNYVKDEVIKIILEDQLEKGRLPIGHVVNNDFIIDSSGKIIKGYTDSKPILLSVECLKDMLEHQALKDDLKKYQKNLHVTYDWVLKSLRKDAEGRYESPSDAYLGWYPEYESKHDPESWAAAHTIMFLKYYEEMLAGLLSENSGKYLHAKKFSEIQRSTIRWGDLLDSYNIKKFAEYLNTKSNRRSALIYGPPGTGKSTIAKALAKERKMDYIQITPGMFSEEKDKIVSRAMEIFKRLNRMTNSVIFFDEVDQLVKSRTLDSDTWVVTSLLPAFSDLHDNNNLIFILATNKIEDVDEAIMRPGRIDIVAPMGSISWIERYRKLYNEIKAFEAKNDDCKKIGEEILGGLCDENINKESAKGVRLTRNFLRGTDFVSISEINNVLRTLFQTIPANDIKKHPYYKNYFEDDTADNSKEAFKKFHNNLLDFNKKEYKKAKTTYESIIINSGMSSYEDYIKTNIFTDKTQ